MSNVNSNIEEKDEIVTETTISDDNYEGQSLNPDMLAESLGCGLFQYLMTVFGIITIITEGNIIQTFGIIIIAACDLQIKSYNKGWLSLSFLFGLAISSAIWGIISDKYERRKLLQISLFINVIFTILAALSYNYPMLLVVTFFNGIGSGGVLPLSYTYVFEFFPKANRGKAVSLMSAGFAGGSLYASAMAVLIIPSHIDLPFGSIRFTSWRLYLILCSLPAFIAFVTVLFLPKSPRHLFKQGEIQKAMQTASKIKQLNQYFCKDNNNSYKFISNHSDVAEPDSNVNGNDEKTPIMQLDISQANDSKSNKDNARIMKLPWLKYLILVSIIWFCYCFALYGLWLWLPSLYTFYVDNPQTTCIGDFQSKFNLSSLATNHSVCLDIDHQKKTYIQTMLTSVSVILLIPISYFLINFIGRKWLFGIFSILSGVCVFFIWIVNSAVGVLILSCTFAALSISGWLPLSTWSLELFPTQIRATATGIIYVAGRLGAIAGTTIFALFLHSSCTIPILSVAILCILSACTALFLHDTSSNDVD